MDNKTKKGILSILGMGLSLTGAVLGYVSGKIDDELQTEKIYTAVDKAVDIKIANLDFSNMEENHVQ